VHVVELEVALLHRTLALPRQLPQHRAEMLAELIVPCLAPLRWNPYHMGPCTPT
jgi:hypothetical protein